MDAGQPDHTVLMFLQPVRDQNSQLVDVGFDGNTFGVYHVYLIETHGR